jgi:hypothetical protein
VDDGTASTVCPASIGGRPDALPVRIARRSPVRLDEKTSNKIAATRFLTPIES